MNIKVINSSNYTNLKIQRTEYTVVEAKYTDFPVSLREEPLLEAKQLLQKVNHRSANTGGIRSGKTLENDVYAGLLAEYATMIF